MDIPELLNKLILGTNGIKDINNLFKPLKEGCSPDNTEIFKIYEVLAEVQYKKKLLKNLLKLHNFMIFESIKMKSEVTDLSYGEFRNDIKIKINMGKKTRFLANLKNYDYIVIEGNGNIDCIYLDWEKCHIDLALYNYGGLIYVNSNSGVSLEVSEVFLRIRQEINLGNSVILEVLGVSDDSCDLKVCGTEFKVNETCDLNSKNKSIEPGFKIEKRGGKWIVKHECYDRRISVSEKKSEAATWQFVSSKSQIKFNGINYVINYSYL